MPYILVDMIMTASDWFFIYLQLTPYMIYFTEFCKPFNDWILWRVFKGRDLFHNSDPIDLQCPFKKP